MSAGLQATWARGDSDQRHDNPGVRRRHGRGIRPEALDGSAPAGLDEIAFAPTTMKSLGVKIGDRVTVGDAGRSMRVVGTALLPETSHTAYDQSAWVTRDSLMSLLEDSTAAADDEFFEDYLLLKWRPDADVAAARDRMAAIANSAQTSTTSTTRSCRPASTASGRCTSLPLTLAAFFAMLAVATVAHALATTVRRRRSDLAVLRSIGFTRTDAAARSRGPSHVARGRGRRTRRAGRNRCRALAVEAVRRTATRCSTCRPLALVAVLLAAPVAVAVSNLLALGPARNATRVRPAEVLRSE